MIPFHAKRSEKYKPSLLVPFSIKINNKHSASHIVIIVFIILDVLNIIFFITLILVIIYKIFSIGMFC